MTSEVGALYELDSTLARLQNNPNSMLWTERRQLVRQISESLQAHQPTERLMKLIDLLASDPKGEVRLDVAELLAFVPEPHFAGLAAKLSEDSFSFAQRAAQRAIERRYKGREITDSRVLKWDKINSDIQKIEQLFGKPAAEMTLKVAEDMYGLLVGSSVHSLRTIVTPIKLNAETMQRRADAGELDMRSARSLTGKMIERLEFLERLIERMRRFSRVASDMRGTERLEPMVRESIALARDGLNGRKALKNAITFHVDAAEELAVCVVKDAIVVAFTIVLENALDAFEDKSAGTIVITAKPINDECIEVVFRDDGKGMQPEALARVQKFAPGTTLKGKYGTGYGLPVVAKYIKANGGSVSIDSIENSGTTVVIRLPREPEDLGEE